MWQFLVTLLLALLYPGSLLLPAIFGLVLTILPALLGTVLGDFVDGNPRMRGHLPLNFDLIRRVEFVDQSAKIFFSL